VTVRFIGIGIAASGVRHRVSQALAYGAFANAAIPIPPWLASLLNDAIAPHFDALAPADRAHLVAVASWLAGRGGSDDVITAGLLHDVGKAALGLRVGLVDRVANVLLRALWPRGLQRIAELDQPLRIGSRLWVVARHATVGAELVASAGYSQRVQWLIANHERCDLDDVELRLLIAADGASANLPTR
jgi:hypothetical protein